MAGAKRPSILTTIKAESKDGSELDPEEFFAALVEAFKNNKKYRVSQALFEPHKESKILEE